MKYIFLITGMLLSFSAISQERFGFLIDEIYLSVNRTELADENTENRIGFGIGINHLFFPAKNPNFLIGLEYNLSGQLKKRITDGHYSHFSDLTYHLNCMSIPVGFRYNFGKTKKIFTEFGAFYDFNIGSTRKGTRTTYFPGDLSPNDIKKYQIDEKVNLSNSVGPFFGIGSKIAVSNFDLLVKMNYRYSLNPVFEHYEKIFNRYFLLSIGIRKK